MPNSGGLPSWASTIGSLVAVTIFGATAGGIAGFEKAQGVTEAQRLWFEQRLAAVQEQVREGRIEIRSNMQTEWDSFEARVIKALERKVDVGTEREMMQRVSDQLTDVRRRIEALEAQVHGRR
jgi:hypothetical protein